MTSHEAAFLDLFIYSLLLLCRCGCFFWLTQSCCAQSIYPIAKPASYVVAVYTEYLTLRGYSAKQCGFLPNYIQKLFIAEAPIEPPASRSRIFAPKLGIHPFGTLFKRRFILCFLGVAYKVCPKLFYADQRHFCHNFHLQKWGSRKPGSPKIILVLIPTRDTAFFACRLYGGGKPAAEFHRIAYSFCYLPI